MGTEVNEKKTKSNTSKIRWRQHEMILVTVIAVAQVSNYLWTLYHLSDSMIKMRYAGPFTDMHVPFNLYRNVILPDLGIGLLIYLTYLWQFFYAVPRLFSLKKFEAGTSKISISGFRFLLQGQARRILKKYGWFFIQMLLLILLLGTAIDVATYFNHEWQFHYPGFSIFFNKNNPNSQLGLSKGFFDATAILLLYALYVSIRERAIKLITTSKQKEYYTLVCNKVTSFVLQFVCVPVFLATFNIVREHNFFVTYFLVVPALFALFMSNVYWVFPMKGDNSFFSKKIIVRLLLTSFICAAPLMVLIKESAPLAFLYSWAFQLFIVTPVTWLYYQSNKDKILQLRVVEKELAKSKTDLQFLRSQINPHFLFNALNTMYGMALQEHAERTAESIQRLGDMMRFMLHENNLDFIQMSKEIDYLKNYIALQKLRTQTSTEVIIEDNIHEQNCNHKIAPMMLIPLVENAFKHGISLKERSWIKIHLTCTERNILFEVRNSMHDKPVNDPEKEKSGIGLKNVVERLKLIYPGKFQLSVNGDGKEFFVRISIDQWT